VGAAARGRREKATASKETRENEGKREMTLTRSILNRIRSWAFKAEKAKYPKPQADEKEDAFMSRCMDHFYKEKGKGQRQSVAICMGLWRKGPE